MDQNSDGFTPIDGYEYLQGFSIDRTGRILNRTTGEIFETSVNASTGKIFTRVVRTIGNEKYILTGKALAFVFLNQAKHSWHELSRKYTVEYKDKDRKNISLDNLYWESKLDRIHRLWLERVHASRLKYPYPTGELGLYPNPIPVPGMRGYFFFPGGLHDKAITKDGKVYNLVRERPIEPRIFEDRYWTINSTCTDEGVTKTNPMLVHRILCSLFIGKPEHLKHISVSELFVNHKNGIKSDNRLENLEWVTRTENMDHYYEVLQKGTQRQRFAIVRKNIESGEEERFKSIYELCKLYFLSVVVLRDHILSDQEGRIAFEGYTYKRDNGEPWPVPLNSNKSIPRIHPCEEIRLGVTYGIIGENLETKEIFIFGSIIKACRILNLSLRNLTNTRVRKGSNVPYQGWIFYPFEKHYIDEAKGRWIKGQKRGTV